MAAWRYEIFFRVMKNIFQHEKRNFVSPSGHVKFYLLYSRFSHDVTTAMLVP